MANRLKVLNLTNCLLLESTLDLSAFRSLEILNFEKCSNLTQFGSSVGGLKTLICLNLGSCTNLKVLFIEVGILEELKELAMDNTTIELIPKVIGNLKKLEVLSARGRTNLLNFPQFH